MLKVAVLLCALALSATADEYKGKPVDLDYKAAPVAQVLYTLADIGNVNVVLVDVGASPIDLKAQKIPWDKAMVDAIALAKLAYVREGSVYVVGSQAVIDARKATKRATYKGATVDLDVTDADATDVLVLLAMVTSTPMEAKRGAPRRAHLHVKHVPADQAADLVLLQTGGSAVDKPVLAARSTGCAAVEGRVEDVKLAAIAAKGTTFGAIITDGKSAWVLDKNGCVGEEVEIHALGRDYVELGDKRPIRIDLHPVR